MNAEYLEVGLTDSAMEEKAATTKVGEEEPIVSSSSVIISPEQLGEAIGSATSKASDFLEGGLNAASGLTLQVAGTVKGEVAATRNFVQVFFVECECLTGYFAGIDFS